MAAWPGGARPARRPRQPPRAVEILAKLLKLKLTFVSISGVGQVGPDRLLAVFDDHNATSCRISLSKSSLSYVLPTDTSILIQFFASSMQMDAVAKSRTEHRHRAQVSIVSQIASYWETTFIALFCYTSTWYNEKSWLDTRVYIQVILSYHLQSAVLKLTSEVEKVRVLQALLWWLTSKIYIYWSLLTYNFKSIMNNNDLITDVGVPNLTVDPGMSKTEKLAPRLPYLDT